MAPVSIGGDFEHYGPYRGAAGDPRNEEAPEVVCRGCNYAWGAEAPFTLRWVESTTGDEYYQPADCPICKPGEW